MWKQLFNPFTGPPGQDFSLLQLVLCPLARTPYRLRNVFWRAVVTSISSGIWDKHICHGHDQYFSFVSEAGALQIFERRIRGFGTVICNENLHGLIATFITPSSRSPNKS